MEMAWCAERGIPHSQLLSWDDEDRAKLAAYLIESADRCLMCGTSPWEWEADRFAYEAVQVGCHGCYLKEVAQEGAPNQPGSHVTLVPRRRAKAMRDTPKRAPRIEGR